MDKKPLVAGIIQARMGSTRLPQKTLMPLAGEPMLYHVVERARRAKRLDTVVVATSTSPKDDVIEAFCRERGYSCFRGSESDVLARYYEAAQGSGCDIIVRLTADNPLIDPDVIDRTIEAFEAGQYDYLSNVVPGERTFPSALAVEVFTRAALEKAYTAASEPAHREHVTPYIWQNKPGTFRVGPVLPAPPEYAYPALRLTVDFPEDFALMQKIYETLYRPGEIISTPEALAFLNAHPEVVAINAFRDKEQVKV